MTLDGNSPQVQVGKEPKQRTQNCQTHINISITTAGKEDAQDSTATHQHATITAEKEDATDSTAHKTTTHFQTTTTTATEEDDADSMAKLSFPNSRRHGTRKEGTSRTNTTTTMSWSTTSTWDNTHEEWRVPNQIGVIRDDLRPHEGFDFMGEDGISREQTRPKPGAATKHVKDPLSRGKGGQVE